MGMRKIIDSTNISSQSVNYASSAGNADTVDGYHASNLFVENYIRSDLNDPRSNQGYRHGGFDMGDYGGSYAS
jgi:hypothetical protein